MTAQRGVDPWRRRLYLPAYRLSDAARYAHGSPQTVANWHHRGIPIGRPPLEGREPGEHLSYLELVEVAIVAVFRNLGVSLDAIARTREYMQQMFASEYPFSEYVFKTDGARMLLTWRDHAEAPEFNEVIVADAGGQLGWERMMAHRLAEFDYEKDLALIWHVAGRTSPVVTTPEYRLEPQRCMVSLPGLSKAGGRPERIWKTSWKISSWGTKKTLSKPLGSKKS